jgi:hypothetical protein
MIRRQLKKPRLASATKEDPKLFDAIRELGGLLPKSAGLFVALSGIAYFSGWREATSYYQKLGAPWIVSSIPRFSFIELSAGMMAAIVIFTYAALHNIATIKQDPKKVFWGGSLTLLVAFILPLVPDYLPTRVSPSTQWMFEWANAGLVYVAAGLFLGEAIARFRDAHLKWSPGVVEVIQMAVIFALWITPINLGRARAEYHLAAPTYNLPLATMPNSAVNENWRLVEVLGQMVLLANFTDGQDQPVFRVVPLKDISAIRPPVKLNARPSLPSPSSGKSAASAQSTRPANDRRSLP